MAWRQKTIPELATKNVLDYEDCKNCQWSLICAGGCPVVSSVTNGSAASASPYCEIFKAMIPRLIEIKALRLIQTFLNL
ncbi:MAG: SPASM domain-containing protein [Candidatus Brocadiales bacterium]|nr:SPASM domain-containing protein [Candidatus Brocadiales bacterium]